MKHLLVLSTAFAPLLASAQYDYQLEKELYSALENDYQRIHIDLDSIINQVEGELIQLGYWEDASVDDYMKLSQDLLNCGFNYSLAEYAEASPNSCIRDFMRVQIQSYPSQSEAARLVSDSETGLRVVEQYSTSEKLPWTIETPCRQASLHFIEDDFDNASMKWLLFNQLARYILIRNSDQNFQIISAPEYDPIEDEDPTITLRILELPDLEEGNFAFVRDGDTLFAEDLDESFIEEIMATLQGSGDKAFSGRIVLLFPENCSYDTYYGACIFSQGIMYFSRSMLYQMEGVYPIDPNTSLLDLARIQEQVDITIFQVIP